MHLMQAPFLGDCFVEFLLTRRQFTDVIIEAFECNLPLIRETCHEIDQINHGFSN